MRTNHVPILTAAVAFVGLGSASCAEEVSLQFGLLRQTYSSPRTVSVPRFDGSLGTLTGVRIDFTPEISGTISSSSSSSQTPNSPNGWAAEFTGTARLAGPGFGPTVRQWEFPTQGGTVFQPNTPVFVVFGPGQFPGNAFQVPGNLSSYVGNGSVLLTLSATFAPGLFWSRGGTSPQSTLAVGVVGTVTYVYSPPCLADYDGDGGVDGGDVQAFFADWERGIARSDVNGDGGIDGSDVQAFFARWENGC